MFNINVSGKFKTDINSLGKINFSRFFSRAILVKDNLGSVCINIIGPTYTISRLSVLAFENFYLIWA